MDSDQARGRLDRFVGRVEDLLWSPCVSCQRKMRGPVCEAFPAKIPEDILRDCIDLQKDYPGDHCPVYQAAPGSIWLDLQQREGPRWEPRRVAPSSLREGRAPSLVGFAPKVVCADVGSVPSGNFGWWAEDGAHGSLPSGLAAWVADALDAGLPVALGFECPLFVPLRDDEQSLTRQREGEDGHPFAAGAGAGALVTGLVEAAWVLADIRRRLGHVVVAHLEWSEFACAGSGLYLWEAFVAGSAKKGGHIEDAKVGAEAMMAALPEPPAANAVKCQSRVYSLVGAALLRTGWSTDAGLLHKPCVVIKA